MIKCLALVSWAHFRAWSFGVGIVFGQKTRYNMDYIMAHRCTRQVVELSIAVPDKKAALTQILCNIFHLYGILTACIQYRGQPGSKRFYTPQQYLITKRAIAG